jgi:hypothetical protein
MTPNPWLLLTRQFVGCYTFGFLFADAHVLAQAF